MNGMGFEAGCYSEGLWQDEMKWKKRGGVIKGRREERKESVWKKKRRC